MDAKKKRGRKAVAAATSVTTDVTRGVAHQHQQAVVAEYRVMDTIDDAMAAADADRGTWCPVIMRVKQPADDPEGADAPPPQAGLAPPAASEHAVATLDTECACFWCCHRLHGAQAVGIPVRVARGGKYAVTGTFCGFECAAAFLFNSRELHVNPWASYEMLNAMAVRAGAPTPVKEAPSRLCLRMFGGWMDIDEFRRGRTRHAPLPMTMVSASQVMDDSGNAGCAAGGRDGSSFIPLDHDRVMKAKQNLMKHTSGMKRSIHNKMNLVTGAAPPPHDISAALPPNGGKTGIGMTWNDDGVFGGAKPSHAPPRGVHHDVGGSASTSGHP